MTQTPKTTQLPAYLHKQKEGIFVDLTLFPVGGGFEAYLDQLFNSGKRFRHLDYRLFLGLLYDYDTVLDAHGMNAKVKLADDIITFSPLRKPLYKNVKIDGGGEFAEYFFEPVEVEMIVEEPVYGDPDDEGVAPIIRTERKTIIRPGKLDIDEFITDMWLKGVRAGLDVEAIAEIISRRETKRMNVAVMKAPVEGQDAEIIEASDALRRDDAPKILANGKADLRKFQNRFPQIALGERLLKKKSRVLGKPGCKVNGELLEPEIPEDLDIHALAGPGTKVERIDGVEYIVATRDGFLSLDVETNHISVTEKIENKGGVSIKTTGDLQLSGDEFIEHGEVQEGRAVEGKNMTFHADVYGHIVSQGGFILFESNLSGGSAKSYGGDITANGRTFNSTVEAWDGHVSLIYAESCVILGESVQIDRAVNCEIIADKVEIQNAEGCSIAAKNVWLKSSATCRGKPTMISMLVPDLAAIDAQLQQIQLAISDCKKIMLTKDQAVATIKADPEVARYLTLAASIKQGTVKLTEAQQNNWYQMTAKFSKVTSSVERLLQEKQDQQKKIQVFTEEFNYLMQSREKQGGDIRCTIAEVDGETQVRMLNAVNGKAMFKSMAPAEMKVRLREQGNAANRIFAQEMGELDWFYKLPEITPI